MGIVGEDGGCNQILDQQEIMNINDAQKVEWWLADLDRWDNVILVDGPHSSQEDANKAYYLFGRLGMRKDNRRMAVVKVELFEPEENKEGANEEA